MSTRKLKTPPRIHAGKAVLVTLKSLPACAQYLREVAEAIEHGEVLLQHLEPIRYRDAHGMNGTTTIVLSYYDPRARTRR